MKKLDRITELNLSVINADETSKEGRKTIKNSCMELFTLVSGDYQKVGADELVLDMQNDLTCINFNEPFMCEMARGSFELYKTIYTINVYPKL